MQVRHVVLWLQVLQSEIQGVQDSAVFSGATPPYPDLHSHPTPVFKFGDALGSMHTAHSMELLQDKHSELQGMQITGVLAVFEL